MTSLMLPAGAKDFQARIDFFEENIQRMIDLGLTPGFEIKGSDLSGDWPKELLKYAKMHDGKVTWHANDKLASRMGFSDFDFPTFLDHVLQAKPLFEKGLDAVVTHLGAVRWSEECPDKNENYQYWSPIDAEEMIAQIENHSKVLRVLKEDLDGKLWLENTAPTLFGPGGSKHFLSPQVGTYWVVRKLAYEIGLSKVFDNEHYREEENLFHRLGEFELVPKFQPNEKTKSQLQLEQVSGYVLEKSRVPYSVFPRVPFRDIVAFRDVALYHIGGGMNSLKDGLVATHQPIESIEQAIDVGVLDILHQTSLNLAGVVIEVCGAAGLKGYNVTSRIEDDWEAKKVTFEVVLKLIEGMRDGTIKSE